MTILNTIIKGTGQPMTSKGVKTSLHNKFGIAIDGDLTKKQLNELNALKVSQDAAYNFLSTLYALNVKQYADVLFTEIPAYGDDNLHIYIAPSDFVKIVSTRFANSKDNVMYGEFVGKFLTPSILKSLEAHYRVSMDSETLALNIYTSALVKLQTSAKLMKSKTPMAVFSEAIGAKFAPTSLTQAATMLLNYKGVSLEVEYSEFDLKAIALYSFIATMKTPKEPILKLILKKLNTSDFKGFSTTLAVMGKGMQ